MKYNYLLRFKLFFFSLGISFFVNSAFAQGPTVTISSPVAPVTQIFDSIPFNVTFSRNVTGFVGTDFQILNGTLIHLTPVGQASLFTGYIKPASCGRVTVKIFAGAAQDSLGQQSQFAQDYSLRADTCHPIITFTPIQGNPTGANPVPLHIDFSEPVTGFTASDILIDSGTVSGGITSYMGMDSLFSTAINPTGTATIKVFVVSIDSAAVLDAAGIANDSTWIVLTYNPAFASTETYTDMPSVQIYPNPSSGIINIRNTEIEFDSWQLISLQGQTMNSGNIFTPGEINTGEMPDGVYWLLLKSDHQKIARKIILQK